MRPTTYYIIKWVLSMLVVAGGSQSQAQIEGKADELSIKKRIEQAPYYGLIPLWKGCETASDPQNCSNEQLFNFIYQHLKYPIAAQKAGVEGVVVIGFVIERDGQMTQLKILQDIGYGTGAEVLRVFQQLQEQHTWIPGLLDEEPTYVNMKMPVRFTLSQSSVTPSSND